MAALLAINCAVIWRLFFTEYSAQFSSIEGAFIGLARYISTHWGDLGWFPLWYGGMPFQDTYVPLLHLTTASVASVFHVSAARAYHAVTAITYACGPVGAYVLARVLGASWGASTLCALTYSLYSPSALFSGAILGDIGGYLAPRRMQVLTIYGEGPHVTAMAMFPFVIAGLQRVHETSSRRMFALAAVGAAAVILTNTPGTMAMAMLTFCWITAQPLASQFRSAALAASVGVFGYGIAMAGFPPSTVQTVLGNVTSLHAGFGATVQKVVLVVLLLVVWGTGLLLVRLRWPLFARFCALAALLLSSVVFIADPPRFELLPEHNRFHLEMELAMIGLAACGVVYALNRAPRKVAIVVLVLIAAGSVRQLMHYQRHALRILRPADLAARSEVDSARWLEANTTGWRVFAPGSVSFWLNAFTDTRQLAGCCTQGRSNRFIEDMVYFVNLSKPGAEAELAALWLRALGVDGVIAPGPKSTEVYHDFREYEKFRGVSPVVHEGAGTLIYQVEPHPGERVHLVKEDELVRHLPAGLGDTAEVRRYLDAWDGPARRWLSVQWSKSGEAQITGDYGRGDRLSVQMTYRRGWEASVNGRARPVDPDGIGQIVVDPQCEGRCTVDLVWRGAPDLRYARMVSLVGVLTAMGMMVGRRGESR